MAELFKAALVEKAAELSGEDLRLINQQALRDLKAEEVFTFRLAACNDQVDRDDERFTEEALQGFAELFPGRPVLMDHSWSVTVQIARVYAATVEDKPGGGRQLVLSCYIHRTDRTEDTIAAIEAGILRECSVGVAVERVICSICGKDQRREWCEHIPGREYDGARCVFLLDGAAEVYEVSLVAVPAQPEAGVIKAKRYGGPEGPVEDPQPGKDPGADSQDWQDEALLELEKTRFV